MTFESVMTSDPGMSTSMWRYIDPLAGSVIEGTDRLLPLTSLCM